MNSSLHEISHGDSAPMKKFNKEIQGIIDEILSLADLPDTTKAWKMRGGRVAVRAAVEAGMICSLDGREIIDELRKRIDRLEIGKKR